MEGLVLLRSQRLEVLTGQALFAGAEYLRVAGKNLLGQRRARARQADDEDRPFALHTDATCPLEERG